MLPYIAGSHRLAEKFVCCHFGDSFRHLPFVHGDSLANQFDGSFLIGFIGKEIPHNSRSSLRIESRNPHVPTCCHLRSVYLPALNPIADLFNDVDRVCYSSSGSRTTAGSSDRSSFSLSSSSVIIVIARISRWCRVARDRENLDDASSPLLLQTSMKLYGIDGHVVLFLTFVFERWTRPDSSPSASAQYISASFRHWRLCRGDFATAARRANFFAFAR